MLRVFYIIIIIVSFQLSVEAQRFSDSLRISLITGSSGTDLYAQFGHSAIRVQDFKYKKDLLFNYGTFDFDAPNFYQNFVFGKLLYQLSVGDAQRTFRYYEWTGRQLIDQELLLTKEEKQRIAGFLQRNNLPENRSYLYDFFYDNCATRIRDIFENELGITYENAHQDSTSFREMLDWYVEKTPWINFGMDLILGIPTDQNGGMREEMFLPEYLSSNLKNYARLNGKPLLGKTTLVTSLKGTENAQKSIYPTPFYVMLLFLLIVLLLTAIGGVKVKQWFDRILFGLLGLIGVFFLFMWLGTDHWTVNKNLNMLWANPLLLFLLPLLAKQKSVLRRALLLLMIIMAIYVLVSWNFSPQEFHVAIIPIVLAVLLRYADELKMLPFGKST